MSSRNLRMIVSADESTIGMKLGADGTIKALTDGTTIIPCYHDDLLDDYYTKEQVHTKQESDLRYLPQAKITGTTPLKCPNSVNANAVDWSISGTNVGDLNSDTNKYDIPIVARGKNLISADGLSTFTKQSDGSYLSNTNISTNSKIYVDLPIAQYTLSYDIKSPTGKNYRWFVYFKDGTSLSPYFESNGEYKHHTMIIPAEKQIDYIGAYYTSKSNEVQFKNLQLEFGDTQTSYEPYIAPITTTISLDNALNGTITKSDTNVNLPVMDSEYTIYEVNTTTQPTSMTVEYYQDTNKVINELKNAIVALQSATN